MANTARGNFQGSRPQFPAYPAGQYYPVTQQQQQQQQQYQAYQAYYAQAYGAVGTMQQQSAHPRQPPPPPPPPPGEASTASTTQAQSSPAHAQPHQPPAFGGFPPLETPPLPPLFPWMSPELAQSMTGSQYGNKFKEEATNLPFVPIVVNDADLAKMTEKVMKEQEEVANQQMKFFKEVISQDLPKPLLDLFQPLYCKLCTLTLSSPIVAKDHYNGKRHKKAIEVWFSQHPNATAPAPPSVGSVSGTIRPVANGVMNQSQNAPSIPPLMRQNYPNHPPSGQGQAGPSFQQNQNDRKRQAPSPPPHQQGPPPPRQVAPNAQQQFRPPNPNFTPRTPQNQNDIRPGWAGNNQNFGNPRNQNQISPNQMPLGNPSQNGDFQNKRPRWEGPGGPSGAPVPNRGGGDRGPRAGGQGGGGGPPPKQICELCNVQLSSKVMAEQHFRGKNHAARLAALQEEKGATTGGSGTGTGPSGPPPASSAPKPPIGPVAPPSVPQQPVQAPPPVAAASSSNSNVSGSVSQNQNPTPNFNNNNKSSDPPPHRGGRGGGGGGRGGVRPPFNKASNNSDNFQRNNNNNRFGNNRRGGGRGHPRFK